MCDCSCCEARRSRRALLAQQPERPRCIGCGADIVFGVADAQLDDETVNSSSGIFEKGDLLCFWCSDEMTHEPNEPSAFVFGRA